MRLNRYLTEKTFNISKDVKFIYDKYFAPIINEIRKHAWDQKAKKFIFSKEAINGMMTGKYSQFFQKIQKHSDSELARLSTGDLPSKESKQAHKVNPVEIHCGAYIDGSWYRPYETAKAYGASTGIITLSLHHNALHLVLTNQIDYVNQTQIRTFLQEFQSERVKATIAHEISHWMNDTMHNFNITNLLKTAREVNKPDMIKLNKQHVNMTHFEIDAQIHGLKQLKMQHKKDWNTLQLKDIYFMYSSLRTIGLLLYDNYGKDVGDIWQKMLVKRLHREKLLGKNMKSFAKYPQDFKN